VKHASVERLYVATLSLLSVHQIDAAYWHEWDMFALPGGIQLFDLSNLALLPWLLLGFRAVVLGRPSGYLWSLVMGALGVVTAVIHTGFAAAGFRQFGLPVSTGLIGLCALSGLAQIVVTLRHRDAFGAEDVRR